VTFVYLLQILLVVMLSPFPPPHTQTSYPRPQHPSCPLSQATTIRGGLPPSIMGSRRRHLHCRAVWLTLVDFVLTVTLSMHCRDLAPIVPPTQHPCMQPPSTTHSHPSHDMSAILIKLCSRNIPLRVDLHGVRQVRDMECESPTLALYQ